MLRDLPTLDPHEQALYDDLRNDRLGDRVRLEQERVMYELVHKVVWHCVAERGLVVYASFDATLRTL